MNCLFLLSQQAIKYITSLQQAIKYMPRGIHKKIYICLKSSFRIYESVVNLFSFTISVNHPPICLIITSHIFFSLIIIYLEPGHPEVKTLSERIILNTSDPIKQQIYCQLQHIYSFVFSTSSFIIILTSINAYTTIACSGIFHPRHMIHS